MEQKIRQKKWDLKYRPGDKTTDEAIAALSRETGLSMIPAKLLYTRGYKTKDSVESFLRLGETQFHDPFALQDMEKAVARIEKALSDNEKIRIYGDYDVDGVTSVSLLYLYLLSQGADVGYYIPSRSREGYGLSKTAMDQFAQEGVGLMITVDTGITANQETAYAKELGIDTVITDHHECHNDLPLAEAIVNPHRPDDGYPFQELAGVGVAFKLVCAMEETRCKREGIPPIEGVRKVCHDYADLVAIGTIADVMPVVDENRLIISLGLHRINQTTRPGLRALINAATNGKSGNAKLVNSGFIGFGIAPRINAAGRVSSASIAVELLLSENDEVAAKRAEELCELNYQRQVEENRIAEQAYKKIEQTLDDDTRVIILDDDNWMQGIIGIVSSRVTEKYGLPSILISFDGATRGFPCSDDVGKGSGRSIKGLNLVDALADSEEYLTRFGGHELAAGLSIPRGNIELFRERINAYAKARLTDDQLCLSLDADCEVEMKDLTVRLTQEIDKMEPFGVSNPVPTFILRDVHVVKSIPMAGGKHTKLIVEKDGLSLSAVWFGMPSTKLPFEVDDRIDLLFQLNLNEYQNTVSLQMIVQDAKPSESFMSEYRNIQERYEEIRNGAPFDETENIVPDRDDFAVVYSYLKREYRLGHTVFSIRKLLGAFASLNTSLNYIKLKMMLRIMQELQICGVNEPTPDTYVFEFSFQPTRTSIDKSSILKKLKMQQRKADGSSV